MVETTCVYPVETTNFEESDSSMRLNNTSRLHQMVDGDGNTSPKIAAAGIKSCIAKKHLSHQDYVDCVKQVEGKETCSVIQTNIRPF